MCTQDAALLINEIVSAKVDNDVMFTAFDVSREVQARQEEDGVPMERHRNMKNTIHGEMQQYVDSGLFEKMLCDVGAPNPAFVYYPAGMDPQTYVPQHRAAATNHQPPVVQQRSTLAAAIAGSPTGQNGHRGDARGTLAVPCDTIRSVGIQNGETVYVSEGVQNGEEVLVLDKDYPANGNVLASYTVDRYGNVRITHSTLSTITDNGPGLETYDFEVDGNTIVISKN
jgi:hypothetical protein